jgi:hypothetical protein
MSDPQEPGGYAFNMSIATLMRIDRLLQRLAVFQIIKEPVLIQRCLYELYKESVVFMKADERQDAEDIWQAIQGTNLKFLDKHLVEFRANLYNEMDRFDFFLRTSLYKNGILMAKGEDPSRIIGGYG